MSAGRPMPLFYYVQFAKNAAASNFHRQAAQDQYGGVEEEDGRKLDRVPVTDKRRVASVEVAGALVGVEHDGQGEEEHHVSGEDEEDHHPDSLEEFAGTAAAEALPFVVVAIAPAAGGPTIYGRFTANAGVFSLGFNRIARKGAWHGCGPRSSSDYTDFGKDALVSAQVVFCPVEGGSYIGLAGKAEGYADRIFIRIASPPALPLALPY